MMRKGLLGLAVLTMLAGAVPAATGDGGDAAAVHYVEVGDIYFDPNYTVLHVGDTVLWENVGGTSHTVTSVGPGLEGFDTGDFQPGETFTFTPTLPGVIPYRCVYHPPWQEAVLVVLPAVPAA